jgi:thioredoxin reductase (NADPH)
MLGFVSDIGPLAEWGLTLENDEIIVNSMMETGRPGVYAAGDVTMYPGKLKLIATGFGEAATAVNQAVHWIYPEKKVAPGTRRTWRSLDKRTIDFGYWLLAIGY